MAERGGSERKGADEKPGQESKTSIQKVKSEAEAALTRAKDAEKARLRAEEMLAEAQRALAAARAKLEEESQARVKAEQGRAEAQTALADARKAVGVGPGNTKQPREAPGDEEGEQRISFVVRLAVDERGQSRRTEIEHAQSGKKDTFLGLDVQRLAAFLEMCTRPSVIPGPITASVSSPVTQETLLPGPVWPTSRLTVSDVQVFRMGALGVAALVLNPDEAFVVQARFQLQGPEATALTAHASSFEIQVYAREVTRGTSTLLTTHKANLVRDVLEYTPQVHVPSLSPGLYRLVTLMTLHAPTKIVAHYDGPIVHVLGVQPSAKPAPLLHGTLAH